MVYINQSAVDYKKYKLFEQRKASSNWHKKLLVILTPFFLSLILVKQKLTNSPVIFFCKIIELLLF